MIAGFESAKIAIRDKPPLMQGANAFLNVEFEEIGDSGAIILFGLGRHPLQSPALLRSDPVLRRRV